MKIRQRLAIRFTLVSALLTGAILIFIYVLTRGFVNADFVERLTQQSRLEAVHYATPNVRDVLPPGSFLLVNPVTSIYSGEGELLHVAGEYEIPPTWVAYLLKHEMFNAERGDYTTVGRKYNINGSTYLVFVSDKDLPGQHELDILIKTITVGWLVSLVFAYFLGLYFSGDALQPVNRVVREVNDITQDKLSFRLKVNQNATPDEIDELILTFNALLSRIESAFIAQKRFVQNASHELKTPLTAIMAEAELALTRERSAQEYRRTLQVITDETERLVTITHGLLTLARFEEGDFNLESEHVNIDQLISNSLKAFKLHHSGRDIEQKLSTEHVIVKGSAQLLQIALLNVLDNAAKYSSGKITLTTKYCGDEIRIGVEDYGIGIPENELNRLFTPLFRGSNARGVPGAGLGLPLVDRIMKIHGGRLEITSEEHKGTFCELVLPVFKLI